MFIEEELNYVSWSYIILFQRWLKEEEKHIIKLNN